MASKDVPRKRQCQRRERSPSGVKKKRKRKKGREDSGGPPVFISLFFNLSFLLRNNKCALSQAELLFFSGTDPH